MLVAITFFTSLHAALMILHVAAFTLRLKARRADRRLLRAVFSAALVSGVSFYSCSRRLRSSSGSSIRAASIRASVNALVFFWVVVAGCSRPWRLRINLSVTAHRASSACSARRSNCFCLGLVRTALGCERIGR